MKHFQLLWDGRGTPPDWLGSALDIHSKSTETTLIDDCDEDSTVYWALKGKGKGTGTTGFTSRRPSAAAGTGTGSSSSANFSPETALNFMSLLMSNFNALQHAQNLH
jgi:hypothetical protein